MDDADFDSLMAGMDAPAASEPEAAPAPGLETPPTETVAAAQPPEESPQADTPPVETAPAAPPEPMQVQAPAWDSTENPYFQEAQQFREVRARLAEAQRLQAEQQTAQAIAELADGDAERVNQIAGLLAQATTPLQYQAREYAGRAEQAEHAATALLMAMQHHLPESQYRSLFDEAQTLLGVHGVETMERVAKTRKEASGQSAAAIAERDRRIKELELQLAARAVNAQVDATGADRVDTGASGGANLSWYDRASQATTEDDFFDALFSQAS